MCQNKQNFITTASILHDGWILTHANGVLFSNYFPGRFCTAIRDNGQIHARIKLNIKSNNTLIERTRYNIIFSSTWLLHGITKWQFVQIFYVKAIEK